MKYFFVCILVCYLLVPNIIAQDFPSKDIQYGPKHYDLDNYQEYETNGEMNDGYREGPWVSYSITDSIIYKRSFYENGYPVGEWTTYYPDGRSKRKTLVYDSSYNLIKWTRYHLDRKIVEVSMEQGFTKSQLVFLETFESNVFKYELNLYTVHGKKSDVYRSFVDGTSYDIYYEYSYLLDVEKVANDLLKNIRHNFDECSVSLYYENGLKRRTCKLKDGEVLERESFFYSGSGKLKKKDYYTKDVLVKTEYFDKLGNIKKTKSY